MQRPSAAGPLAAGLTAVGLFTFWSIRDAGSDPADWLLGALLLIGLLVTVIVGTGGLTRVVTRSERIALVALSALTLWAFASIAWADIRADAWNGADRVLLYLVVFTLFLVLRWRTGTATIVLGAYVLATALVATLSLARATSDRPDMFIAGRLSYPTGYPNANAAVFLSGFWVALVLATRRTVPVPLRVGAAMAAALLPQVALLSQSRAMLVAFPVTAAALLIALPGRIRTVVGVAVSVGIVAATWGTHTAVFDAARSGGGTLDSAIGRTSTVAAAAVVLTGIAALGWALVDRRLELSPWSVRTLNRSALAAAVITAFVLAVVAIAAHPVEQVQSAWKTFTAVSVQDNSQPHFTVGLGSNRYDFWRVAIQRFKAEPLTGIGADNFAVDYLRERRSIEEPAYPHSLEVMVLSQLGLLGATLFALFVAAVGTAAIPRRRDEPATAALAGAAVAGSMYFLVHASVDWFWEIPALGAPAFALLGLAISVRACSRREKLARASRASGYATAAALAAAVVAAICCALPWLSHRQVDRAVAVWRSDPESAYDHLERARALNPLSGEPDLVAGAIAARRDDRVRMRSLFARSLERNPYSWYAQLELGLTESVSGRRQAALAAVRRAVALNPQEPLLREVLGRLEQGEQISPRSLDAVFVDRIASRTR